MSRLADPGWAALAVAALAVVLAWSRWDGTMVRLAASTQEGGAVCAGEPRVAPPARSDAFRLGGAVVRADAWCGASTVRVEVSADVADGGFVTLVAATSQESVTLEPPHAAAASLRVGPDGWVAVAIVQADERTMDGGGAWVTLTGGDAPR